MGPAYAEADRLYRVPFVFDELVAKGEMPVPSVTSSTSPTATRCSGGEWPWAERRLQRRGFQTFLKPMPSKSFRLTVANSVIPWATSDIPRRRS